MTLYTLQSGYGRSVDVHICSVWNSVHIANFPCGPSKSVLYVDSFSLNVRILL